MATTSGFGQGLGPAAYCPYGHYASRPSGRSPETTQFYDALVLGAIPAVIDCMPRKD